MKKIGNLLVVGFALFGGALSLAARPGHLDQAAEFQVSADPADSSKSVAVGYRYGNLSGSRFLLSADYGGINQEVGPHTGLRLFMVEFTGGLALSENLPADAPTRVSNYAVHITPLGIVKHNDLSSFLLSGKFEILPTDISKDVAFDLTDASTGMAPGHAIIRLIGVSGTFGAVEDDGSSFYVTAAMDALGVALINVSPTDRALQVPSAGISFGGLHLTGGKSIAIGERLLLHARFMNIDADLATNFTQYHVGASAVLEWRLGEVVATVGVKGGYRLVSYTSLAETVKGAPENPRLDRGEGFIQTSVGVKW